MRMLAAPPRRGRSVALTTAQGADCAIVEAPFESAYRRLTPGSAFAFRQAAVQDGLVVSGMAVAALLDVPEHMALALLDSLADVHLLETCGFGSYRFDALVKLYARRKALAEDSGPHCPSAEVEADPLSLFRRRRDLITVGRAVRREHGTSALLTSGQRQGRRE